MDKEGVRQEQASALTPAGPTVATPIAEIDVLWITAGLGCDGDTIAMTAATQPSLEDILTGGMPWIPKVNFLNPFFAIENGDEFMQRFHLAAQAKLAPFILVVEGSIPDETNRKEGYWASFGTDAATGQPITTCEWIDRLRPGMQVFTVSSKTGAGMEEFFNFLLRRSDEVRTATPA
jgi:Ni,Fe-hydrogenase I small subunit